MKEQSMYTLSTIMITIMSYLNAAEEILPPVPLTRTTLHRSITRSVSIADFNEEIADQERIKRENDLPTPTLPIAIPPRPPLIRMRRLYITRNEANQEINLLSPGPDSSPESIDLSPTPVIYPATPRDIDNPVVRSVFLSAMEEEDEEMKGDDL